MACFHYSLELQVTFTIHQQPSVVPDHTEHPMRVFLHQQRIKAQLQFRPGTLV